MRHTGDKQGDRQNKDSVCETYRRQTERKTERRQSVRRTGDKQEVDKEKERETEEGNRMESMQERRQ